MVDLGEEDYAESNYNFDVVGKSFQRDHLIALLKKNKVIEIGQFQTQATLELEPKNDFDPNAVKVMVDGLQVGYERIWTLAFTFAPDSPRRKFQTQGQSTGAIKNSPLIFSNYEFKSSRSKARCT